MHVLDVRDYGAVGDGKALDTASIRKAAEACRNAGGGTLLFPPGEYLTGQFDLYSNTTLRVASGAVIRGSTNMDDYALPNGRHGPLIAVCDAENITVAGGGNIDGNGDAFMHLDQVRVGSSYDRALTRQEEAYLTEPEHFADGPYEVAARPYRLIAFIRCRNVRLRDVSLTNSPFWNTHVADCDNVRISGVRIANNPMIGNSDGIHVTCSRNVIVTGCDIAAGDDCVAVTGFHVDYAGKETPPDRACENVVVSDCIFSSRSAGLRIGAGPNDVRYVSANNIVMNAGHRGVVLWQRDGSTISNVQVSNMVVRSRLYAGQWWGQGEPIAVSSILRDKDKPPGRIRNVCFANIMAESDAGIMVYGSPDSVIEDLAFENVRLRIVRSPLHDTHGGNFDLRPTRDRAMAIFKHDIPAVYARCVAGLTLRNVAVAWDDGLPEWFTSALHCEHFEDIEIDKLAAHQAHQGNDFPVVTLNDGRGAAVRNCRASKGTKTFLKYRNVEWKVDPERSLWQENDRNEGGG